MFAESPVLLNSRWLELDVCCLEMVLLHSVADSRCLPCSSASESCRCCAGHKDEHDAGELQYRTFQQGKQVKRACKYNHSICLVSCGYKRWRNCSPLEEPLEASWRRWLTGYRLPDSFCPYFHTFHSAAHIKDGEVSSPMLFFTAVHLMGHQVAWLLPRK